MVSLARLRAVGVAILVALALLGLLACGGSSGGEQPVAKPRAGATSAADAAKARQLAAEIARVSDNRGPNAERERLLAILRRAQRAFRAGDGMTVCATMGPEPLEAFGSSLPRCARRANALSRAVRTGELRLVAPAVAWVRVYGDLGGITMVNPNGDRFRLPFVKRDGRWGAHYFFDVRPEVFNAQLGYR